MRLASDCRIVPRRKLLADLMFSFSDELFGGRCFGVQCLAWKWFRRMHEPSQSKANNVALVSALLAERLDVGGGLLRRSCRLRSG